MEILDKSKIKLIANSSKKYYEVLKEKFIKHFRKQPTESVGIYIADKCVYMVSIFYDSGKWHILSLDKEELPLYDGEEKAANWAYEKIGKYKLHNAIVTLSAPDRFLLKRDIEIQNIPKENLDEALHWDFIDYYFDNNQKFNVAYYPIDEKFYFAAALEVKNQKYVDDFFKEKEIIVSKWVTFPDNFKLNVAGQSVGIFDAYVNFPANIDALKLNEYTSAIYAAMVGANLLDGDQNITFPNLYDIEFLDWKLLSLTAFFVGIALISSIFFYDNYKIYSLQSELDRTNEELQSLSINKTRMKIYDDIINDTKLRENIIAEKTQDRIPFQAAFLNLGLITQEGVVLNSIRSDKDSIIVEGEADTEKNVKEFFESFNNRGDIFAKPPKSFKYDKRDKITLSFTIDL